jgi:hypothetical protein
MPDWHLWTDPFQIQLPPAIAPIAKNKSIPPNTAIVLSWVALLFDFSFASAAVRVFTICR